MATRLKAAITALVLGFVIALAGPALADRFIYFGSANGLLKGDVHSYQTTTATSTDVVATFSGTCNSSTVLKGDGTCGSAGGGSGTVTSVNASAAGIFAFSGGPVTTTGTLALGLTGTSGGMPYFSNGTTLSTSAALAANQLILGGGAGTTPATLGSLGTTATVLHGNAAGAPTFGAVALASDVSGDLPFANLTQCAGLSSLANATNGTADLACLTAASDFQVLRRSGTALAYGSVNLASSNAVTGTLPLGNGGGLTTAADDTVAVGSGSAYVATALTSCSGASSAVTYNTTTNAFGCNTISGGTSQTTGTFTITWDDGCTTSPTSPVSWTLTGVVVTWVIGPMSPTQCTSDSTNMRATSTATVPMALRPTASQYVGLVYTIDAGGAKSGCIGVASNGIVDAVASTATGCPGVAWTNSGNKSVGFDRTTTIVYQLN